MHRMFLLGGCAIPNNFFVKARYIFLLLTKQEENFQHGVTAGSDICQQNPVLNKIKNKIKTNDDGNEC